jgi:hypothetical protein
MIRSPTNHSVVPSRPTRARKRIEARIADLEPTMTPGAKGEAVAQIVAEETARSTRRAVAGFDFTFSIPKSASCCGRSPTPGSRH